MSRLKYSLFLLTVLLSFFVSPIVWACAIASQGNTAMAQEEALIIWDKDTQMEHFIRRASLKTKEQSLGFLVPTPTQPVLGEVSQDVFPKLFKHIQPVEEIRTDWHLSLLYEWFKSHDISEDKAAETMPSASDVQVMAQKNIAGYQATVLKAQDVQALTQWLKKRNYPLRPALEFWLKPFVKQGWFITAFQLNQLLKAEQLDFKAVKLSFKVAVPFYPYSEPQEQQVLPYERSLRLFLISNSHLNDVFRPQSGTFDAKYISPILAFNMLYSAPLETAQVGELLQNVVSRSEIPATPWLTAYMDFSSQRPISQANGKPLTELFFEPSATQRSYVPKKIKHEERLFPLDVVLLGCFVLWLVFGQKRDLNTT